MDGERFPEDLHVVVLARGLSAGGFGLVVGSLLEQVQHVPLQRGQYVLRRRN